MNVSTHPRADRDGIVSKNDPADKGNKQPDIAKQIADDVKTHVDKKLENVVTKSDVQPIQNKLNDLEQAQKELKAAYAGGTKVYERWQDDPALGFKSLGQFLTNVIAQRDSAPSTDVLKHLSFSGFVSKAPSGASVTEGASLGYTIPPAFSTMIWDGMHKDPDNLLSRTDQYTVQGESLEFLANAETNRATGSRYGGIQGYWIAEADTITSSKPKLRKMKLEPQELAVLVYLTDKLISRSPVGLEQYVSRAAREEIQFLTNDAVINGTGAGQPLGILNSPCLVSVSKESNQAAATINANNIDKMFARLHPRSRSNAVWLHNVDIQPQLDALSQAVGSGGVPLYRPPGGLAGSPLATLKGLPLVPTEFNATLGTVGDLILADMSKYASAVHGDGVKTAMSIHVQFLTAQTAFRFMFAVDGQPWLASAITPYKGSNTLSPFVALATRS